MGKRKAVATKAMYWLNKYWEVGEEYWAGEGETISEGKKGVPIGPNEIPPHFKWLDELGPEEFPKPETSPYDPIKKQRRKRSFDGA